ncbi:hypothetical protein [Serratia sp. 22264]|uniref:hypothetical protein n=1 Tax=Serratia sp. 22264 TaxID=3453897 RepID=UPI003F8776F3
MTGITSLECSRQGCILQDVLRLVHTNHPLASQDVNDNALALLTERGRVANSYERLRYLEQQITELNNEADIYALLSDSETPIAMLPGHGRLGQTFGSVVYRLGEETRASFALASPGQKPWLHTNFLG